MMSEAHKMPEAANRARPVHVYIQLDKVRDMDRCQMGSRAMHRRPEAKR